MINKRTIFILGTITFILFLTGRDSFAQALQQKLVPDIYSNSDLSQVISGKQVFIKYTREPSGAPSESTIFTLNDLVSKNISVDWDLYRNNVTVGRYRNLSGNKQEIIAIIDSEYYYVGAGSLANSYTLTGVSSVLDSIGLGTVKQRSDFFNYLNSSFFISPLDFRSHLSGWIWAGIVIFIALPMLWIMKKFLRR